LIAQGYDIGDARNGEEALERVRSERFDLVVLDMNMPGIVGVETCRSLRAGSDLAIIMLTVRDSEQDKVQARDAGAGDHLTKPFAAPDLRQRYRRLSGTRAASLVFSNSRV
jgi:two-component system, OmpR family, KDP operon response regulator KdpE